MSHVISTRQRRWLAGMTLALAPAVLAPIPANAQSAPGQLPGLPIEVTNPNPRQEPPAQDPPVRQASEMSPQAAGVAESTSSDKPDQGRQENSAREASPAASNEDDALKVKPGQNQVIAIAQGHPNRIVTPYERPQVRTVHEAEIEVSGSVIYVTTGHASPVTLYVTEGQDESSALSLTLVPRRIPPRELRLQVAGYTPRSLEQRIDADRAGSWERSHPLRKTVMEALKSIARGQVPPGYGLDPQVKAAQIPFRCDGYSGAGGSLAIGHGQRVAGRNLIIWVASARNTTDQTVEVRGPECYRDGVLAVAPWPRARLKPGERTELYVVERRLPPSQDAQTRPSVLDTPAPEEEAQ